MDEKFKKIFRTLQSELPFLKKARDSFDIYVPRILHRPHENDFKALTLIPDSLQGCYVDVGANRGQSIASIQLFKPRAEIFAFEANPYLAEKLTARYRGKVRVVAKGLSDSPGHFTLFVPSYKGYVYDGLASLDKQAAASWISEQTVLRFNPTKVTIAEVQCDVTTLDAYQLVPIFIKVDVQGYEYNVLNGGRETLRRYQPILLVESFRADLRTVQLAEELGYEEYHFDGLSLRKASAAITLNSFLITPRCFKTLFGRSKS